MEHIALLPENYKNSIFEMFDSIRSEGRRDAFNIVPVVLVTARLGIPLQYHTENSSNSVSSYFTAAIRPDLKIDTHTYQELLKPIRDLSLRTVKRLAEISAELNLSEMPVDNFKLLFDFTLDGAMLAAGGHGNLQEPSELAELITSIYKVWPSAKVFNPYARTGQMVAFLKQSVFYTGEDFDSSILALAQLRLIAHETTNAVVKLNDSVRNWPEGQYWDFIFCASPMLSARRADDISYFGMPRNTTPDVLMIHQALAHLKEDGKAVLAVFPGFLWRGGTTLGFRRHLVEQDWLEYVIELPSGVLLPATSLGITLLVFNPRKQKAGEILFLEAEPHTPLKDRRRIINVDSILQVLQNPAESKDAAYVSQETVATNDYSLSAKRYILSQETRQNDVELGSLVTIVRQGPQSGIDYKGRLVTIRVLKNDSLDYGLDTNALTVDTIQPKNANSVAEDVLLVALRGQQLKPTWYVYKEGADLFAIPEIAALRVDTGLVDVAYLVSELNSEYVLNQVKAFQTGVTIPTISRRDLMRLRIRVPGLDEQRAKVEGAKEALIKLKEQELEQLISTRAQKQESYEQLATLKHALGRPLLNLSSSLSLLHFFIRSQAELNQPLALSSRPIASRADVSVQSIFDSMRSELKFVQSLLVRKDSELIVEDFPLETVNLIEFLRELVVHTATSSPNFEIELEEDFVMSITKSIPILANRILLQRLFYNILDNAQRHGFDGREAGNRIVIYINYLNLETNPTIQLSICNNGKPLPENFTQVYYVRRNQKEGATGRSGIGGFEVNEIIRYFKGFFKLTSNPKSEFPVDLTFQFPIVLSETADDNLDDENI